MNIAIVCIVVVLAIFISAYMTKRHFGLLGLAMAVGSILSGIWAYEAGLVAGIFGISSNPVSSAIIAAIITLLPCYLLLPRARAYKTALGRLLGAGLFTALAVAFLIGPFSNILILQGSAAEIYRQVLGYKDLIIGVGLIVAILDLLLTKSAESSEKKHER